MIHDGHEQVKHSFWTYKQLTLTKKNTIEFSKAIEQLKKYSFVYELPAKSCFYCNSISLVNRNG